MMNKYILTLLTLFTFSATYSQENGIFQKKEFIAEGDTLKYQILYPKNYDASKKYPLVLFLHGAGERGNDNERQLHLGSFMFLDSANQEDYPAIVLYPQCPMEVMWTHRQKFEKPDRMVFEFPVSSQPPRPTQLVNQLVEELMAKDKIDTNQMYVTGISMGGIASLEYMYRWPEKYNAAIIVCGGHNADLARYYKEKAVWFIHGDADPVIPIYYAKSVYKELKKGNKKTKFTVLKGADHSIWTPAFGHPDFLKWMFQHKKEKSIQTYH